MANLDCQKIRDCSGNDFKRKVYNVTAYKSGVTLGLIHSTASTKRSHRVTLTGDSWLVLGIAK